MKLKMLSKNSFLVFNGWHEYKITIISSEEFSVDGFSDYEFFLANGEIKCTNKTRNIKKTISGKICLYSDVIKNRTSINVFSFTSLIGACFRVYEEKRIKNEER
jgi:hypothetical protein